MIAATVKRTPGAKFDRYGDPNPTVDHEVVIEAIGPRTSTEVSDRGRQGVAEELAIYARAGTDIRRGDVVVVDDAELHVVGAPKVFESPFGDDLDGIEVPVERREG